MSDRIPGLSCMVVGVGLALWLVVPGSVASQEVDTDVIGVYAEVIQALSVVGERDLEFGTVLGGTTVTVGTDEAAAGKFEIIAAPGSDVNFQFTQLPTQLDQVGGSAAIPLELLASYGLTDNPGAGTPIVLTGSGVQSVFPESGLLFVWVGGTITPAAAQAVGSYEATVELTASYVGN